uniref:NADAR domain-containing protein n=1 Tax=Panagrolaimus sp. ES5 TaxID=591445 RepID=A0AC34GBK2_9BILA
MSKKWQEGGKVQAMAEAIYLKFSQNENLKTKLLNTGDAFLVECNPFDEYWGIKKRITDEDVTDSTRWPENSNALGFLKLDSVCMLMVLLINKSVKYALESSYGIREVEIGNVNAANGLVKHVGNAGIARIGCAGIGIISGNGIRGGGIGSETGDRRN